MNPHFLLPLSALWLWGISGSDGPRSQLKSFAIACVVTLMAQLHLSAAAVGGTSVAIWSLLQRRPPRILGTFFGSLTGGLTLLPWISHQITQASSQALVSSNSGLHLELMRPLQFFSRFLTFPTADIARFIEAGHGYKDLGVLFTEERWLIVPALVALAGSLVIVLASLRTLILRRTEALFKIYWLAVACTSILFLFSIKGPSAHTFWIWFPLAFVPAAAAANEVAWTRRARMLAGIYLVAALTFTLGVQQRADRVMAQAGVRVMDFQVKR